MKRIVLFAMLASGCVAADPKKIEPMSVSAIPYQALDCAALAAEDKRVAGELAPLIYEQSDRRKTDVIMIAAIGVSSTGMGENDHAANIARLRGEREALAQAKATNKCAEPQAAVDVEAVKRERYEARAQRQAAARKP